MKIYSRIQGAIKQKIVEKVLKYMKVPEPIKKTLAKSEDFVDCVMGKIFGCSFIPFENPKVTYSCYAAMAGMCVKSVKNGVQEPPMLNFWDFAWYVRALFDLNYRDIYILILCS